MLSRRRLALMVALTVAFALLTAAVAVRTPVVRLDEQVWHLTLRLRNDPLVEAARVVTSVFSPPVTGTAVFLVAVAVSKRLGSLRPLLWAAVAVTVMAALTRGLKLALARPGPGSLHAEKLNGAYPSGHTASLMVCGGVIVLLLGLRSVRAAWVTYGAIVVLVVGCLVYAHQHWLSDVVGSALMSGVVLLALDHRLTYQLGWRRGSISH